MNGALRVGDRERTATRLIRSAARASYDPDQEIDWEAAFEEKAPFLPPERVSLYGTALWERMTEDQRIELSKHEFASQTAVGIWLELSLMHLFLRKIYHQDPRTAHARFALTEVGDETRHSVMFARLLGKMGTPQYGIPPIVHHGGRVFKAVGGGPSMWAIFLIGEEVFDRVQRASMDDERVQPLVRAVNRIHVVEESRHVRYAREELVRSMRGLGRAAMARHRLLAAVIGTAIVEFMIDPKVYRCVGLSPDAGRKAAAANPHFLETRHWLGEKIMPFLAETGIVAGPGTALWRHSGLIR
ncbi:diiron oxygenase [Actinomadura sp. LD22]|uniref:Diiron oxygenase n=2 Tax=Actinomadura physcomitrii TaxID=2650748 RepID=A0A6I4M727_9ACTN|nr:diiron oxygenase [Actinomadura physcomitrii]